MTASENRTRRSTTQLVAIVFVTMTAGVTGAPVTGVSSPAGAASNQRPATLLTAQSTQTADAAEQERLRNLRERYQFEIHQTIVRQWNRRKSVDRTLYCDVKITQQSDGTIAAVEARDCTGDDAFRASVEAAIWKASPLPLPPDPALFERHIQFRFQAR